MRIYNKLKTIIVAQFQVFSLLFGKRPQKIEYFEYSENSPVYNSKHLDIDYIDFYILSFLTILLFITGIFSTIILDYISINSTLIISRVTLILT